MLQGLHRLDSPERINSWFTIFDRPDGSFQLTLFPDGSYSIDNPDGSKLLSTDFSTLHIPHLIRVCTIIQTFPTPPDSNYIVVTVPI